MPAPDQQRLAQLLRLSPATVSRSLSNHPAVAAATRERVRALASKLGYRSAPTRVVRRSRRAKPITLGVLIGSPLVPADRATLPLILDGITRRAAIDHVAVDVAPIDTTALPPVRQRREIFRRIRSAGWRGAVLIYPFPTEIVDLLARKISLVSVLTEYPSIGVDAVDTDHGDVRRLVTHLTALGHRRIGFVSWAYPVGGVWASRRFAAYAEALVHAGLELNVDWVVNIGRPPTVAAPDAAAVADAVAHRVRSSAVTAWIAAADHQAYPLLADLRTRGLLVPRDCSITGFDGSPPPPGGPRLTSLGVPNEHLGASAVARLLSRLLHPGSPRRTTLVETTFIAGATTAPPPAT